MFKLSENTHKTKNTNTKHSAKTIIKALKAKMHKIRQN
jgi:hypothetical protein